MRFSFNVKLTDEDYYLFNEFVTWHSPLGKKIKCITKIIDIIGSFLASVIVIYVLNRANIISPITAIITIALFPFIFIWIRKKSPKTPNFVAKSFLKGSKKPYTPDSTLEFYDGFFKEIAPDNKSEINYTAVDKISVVKNRYVFIFLDGIRGYVVPFDCFESEAEAKEFTDFLGTVCNKAEFYEKL